MRVDRVLHGQRMEFELAGKIDDLVGRRLVQPDPHERVRRRPRLVDLVQVESAALAGTLHVERAVDDHVGALSPPVRGTCTRAS